MKTPTDIAKKYVHGLHDAFTDKQEIIDMAADIQEYAIEYSKYYANLKSKDSIPLGDIILNEFIQGIRNTKSNGEARRFIMGYCKKLNK